MLIVHHGNRLERLAGRLADVIREPAGAPLEPEVVLVQNAGMARWISLRLAESLGVCANLRFPFPAAFLWDVFRTVIPEVPETSPFDPAVLTWRLLGRFPDLPSEAAYQDLHAYIEAEDDASHYDLAWRIADVFDRYLVYRPDWIEGFERGEEDHWQALLWRDLAGMSGAGSDSGNGGGESGAYHRVRLHREFLGRLAAAAEAGDRPPGLPGRVSLFGIPALAPVYVDLFEAIGHFVDVHLFLLNPSRQYWGEIVSDRTIARRGVDADEHHLETGNALLASMGLLGRDFIDKVISCDGKVEEEHFEEPDEQTLLGAVQSDILDLRNRGDEGHPSTPVASDDDSIQVHSCHGPMREVEVLYDRLLDLFRRRPDLRPSDVVVMTPDIEAYAPYIEAVFGTVQDDARRIPYTLADRSPRTASPLVDVFFEILDVLGSRFDANRTVGLLESTAVRRRFGFVDDDLEIVRRWIRDTGIRWGIDETTRENLGLPETREHTWRAGLDRMLLGYALPGRRHAMFDGILPYDEIEGGRARVLGRLQTFAESLFALAEDVRTERSPAAWCETLRDAVERFLDPSDDESNDARKLREGIGDLEHVTSLAGFERDVPLDSILAHLRRSLGRPDPAAGFLGGDVTFCAMMPMRSIPFEVVCLIGLDDARYPRTRRPHGFDRMGRDWRPGDRSGRDDDRYLFLEAILSARSVLYISHVGQSIRDNNPIPPSVVVSELLDAIERGFHPAEDPEANLVTRQVVTRHPLQAFSRRYFTGEYPELFSYSREQCQASALAGRGEGAATPFLAEPLPEAGEEWKTVPLEHLVRFFAHPVRFLVQRRMRLYLDRGEGLLETREPFELDRFEGEDLREDLLMLRSAGEPIGELLPLARARGVLPHGGVGAALFESEVETVQRFGAQLDSALAGTEPRDPLEIDLVFGDLRLVGRLAGVTSRGLVAYRPGPTQGRDRTSTWIRHLVLCSIAPPGIAHETRWIHADGTRVYRAVDDARERLRSLLGLYWRGLHEPLPLFARSSYAYASTLRKRGEGDARIRAWKVYHKDGMSPEGVNPYCRLVYRGSNPVGTAEFRELSESVYGAILDHGEDVGEGGGGS